MDRVKPLAVVDEQPQIEFGASRRGRRERLDPGRQSGR